MDILFVASELAPYAKVGGLADVMAALTKTLRQHGHKVTLALPRYRQFEQSGLLLARRLTPLQFEFAGAQRKATLYDGRLPSGVDITLLDLPGLFDREGVYGAGADYADNPTRFAVFSYAVAEMIRQRLSGEMAYDLVHVHDWPTALVPFYARIPPNDLISTATKFALTIHNIEFQGISPASSLAELGIPQQHFHPEGAEFYGNVNILKTGIIFSDAITTVSETYAREIQTQEQGAGLHGLLASRASRLSGIPNGIDYSLWNPATDPALIARFDAEDATSKARCKADLMNLANLEMVADRPLIAFADRLVHQKGIELLLDAVSKLVLSNAAIVIAGDGESTLGQRAAAAASKFPGRVAFLQRPLDRDVHRVLAGADMVILPSLREPCGQVQLLGQRYGTVPIVRATGGLIDTVIDCDAAMETGTGFVFEEPSPQALIGAVQRAVAAFASPRWPLLRRRVMRIDVGWDRSAHRYEQLYRSLVT